MPSGQSDSTCVQRDEYFAPLRDKKSDLPGVTVPFINHSEREIVCKIVYAGPAYSGKTTSQIGRASCRERV